MALHTESEFFFLSFYEDKEHLFKERTKLFQSQTNKSAILKVKGKGWFNALFVFNKVLWGIGELTYT